MDRRAHWDETYTIKADSQVSWFQETPEPSLTLIKTAAPSHKAAIIDIGGGASRIVDHLLAAGYDDLSVLDLSSVALEQSRARLGPRADNVSWIVADITQWQPPRQWEVWHDRAVFHFLTDPAAQESYLAALKRGTRPGSAVIIATFALDGPERCSGLPVQRYSPATLAGRLGGDFALHAAQTETHPTPFGTTQRFSFAAFRRL